MSVRLEVLITDLKCRNRDNFKSFLFHMYIRKLKFINFTMKTSYKSWLKAESKRSRSKHRFYILFIWDYLKYSSIWVFIIKLNALQFGIPTDILHCFFLFKTTYISTKVPSTVVLSFDLHILLHPSNVINHATALKAKLCNISSWRHEARQQPNY